jgi:cation transport ATPase
MENSEDCHVEELQKTPAPDELAQVTDTLLLVGGMGCPRCAMRVRNGLISQRGVVDALVDHVTGRALVRHNPAMASIDALLRAVESAGNDGRHRYFAALA